jgi:hypothetical protein
LLEKGSNIGGVGVGVVGVEKKRQVLPLNGYRIRGDCKVRLIHIVKTFETR